MAETRPLTKFHRLVIRIPMVSETAATLPLVVVDAGKEYEGCLLFFVFCLNVTHQANADEPTAPDQGQ